MSFLLRIELVSALCFNSESGICLKGLMFSFKLLFLGYSHLAFSCSLCSGPAGNLPSGLLLLPLLSLFSKGFSPLNPRKIYIKQVNSGEVLREPEEKKILLYLKLKKVVPVGIPLLYEHCSGHGAKVY